MKRLTVGSLKEKPSNQLVVHSEPIPPKMTIKQEALLEISQNHLRFLLPVENNQTILEAALIQKLPLEFKCQKGTCGKCQVRIESGHQLLQQVNHLENQKLQHLVKYGFRLACQAKAK